MRHIIDNRQKTVYLPSILNFTPKHIAEELIGMGEKSFRAEQILREVYKRFALDFQAMSTLPVNLRERLENQFSINPLEEVITLESRDGSTKKSLFRLPDGELIETVQMHYSADSHRRERMTVCISTQAGCAFGCTFCATGQQKFTRHLEPAEIVAQVLFVQRRSAGQKSITSNTSHIVTNVVFMGMGEPLHNYDNTMTAIRIMNHSSGMGIGARRITVSTVGLVPQIKQLADEGLQVNLAVSLHAADDETRSETMPVNKKWPLAELMAACRTYCDKTGRRIFFEYVLLKDQNDSREQARRLGKMLQPLICHVNLIPVNPTAQGPYNRTDRTGAEAFQSELARFGVPSTQRMEKGIDIQAGCGQLRSRVEGTIETHTR